VTLNAKEATVMSRRIVGWLLYAASLSSAWATDQQPSCEDKARSQTDLNICAGAEFKRADDQLNAVYQSVLEQHRADSGFVRRLQAAQRAWMAWRDAEMEALYPDRSDWSAYGSVFPMCWNAKLTSLTETRTRQLKQWLDGVLEGEVCAGSLPVKP
jgi:uncharacterized protein YecT (DUF1311 family)